MILRMKGQTFREFDETFGITSFAEVDFFCPSLAFETPLTLAPAHGSKYFVSYSLKVRTVSASTIHYTTQKSNIGHNNIYLSHLVCKGNNHKILS